MMAAEPLSEELNAKLAQHQGEHPKADKGHLDPRLMPRFFQARLSAASRRTDCASRPFSAATETTKICWPNLTTTNVFVSSYSQLGLSNCCAAHFPLVVCVSETAPCLGKSLAAISVFDLEPLARFAHRQRLADVSLIGVSERQPVCPALRSRQPC